MQLPLFNEMYVAARLLDAIALLEYPRDKLEIQVLDDSTDETQAICRAKVEELANQGLDIQYIHRTDRTGFKAGALEHGLKTARGEFVMVFDADFLPPVDFIERTVHFFTNAKVGMVQVRWDHVNRDYSRLTELQAMMLDGHFVIEHTARHRSGRFFNFNGTAGIWRREAIADAGGWSHDTLTEDMDLSYRAQLRGWEFIYLKDVVSPAELPVEMNAFKSQQFRWAKGSIQVAKKLLPTIWRSKDVPFNVKLEAFFHLTNNFAYPLLLLLSILLAAQPARAHAARAARGAADRPAAVLRHDAVDRVLLHHLAARDSAQLEADAAAAAAHDVARHRPVHQPDARGRRGAVRRRVGRVRAHAQARRGAPLRGLDGEALPRDQDADPVRRGAVRGLLRAAPRWWRSTPGHYVSLPFMLLFTLGFGYVGVLSLHQSR